MYVNSENNPWLSWSPFTKKNKDLKPNGFATYCGMYHKRSGQGDLWYGVAEPGLFECLILFEGKLNIGDRDLGKVVQYFQNLAPKTPASAVLFSPELFWLIQSDKAIATKIQEVKWPSFTWSCIEVCMDEQDFDLPELFPNLFNHLMQIIEFIRSLTSKLLFLENIQWLTKIISSFYLYLW